MMERLFVILTLFSLVTASKVTFQATPSELKNNLTEVAFMRCSVDDSSGMTSSSGEDVHRVMSLFVTRANGQDVASVTSTDAPMGFVEQEQGNLQVTGSISAVSGEGYIQLSWTDPSKMALGEYVCKVTARDARGHTMQLTQSLELTASDPTINDVIEALKHHNMMNKLENEKQQQEISRLRQCTSPHVGFTATFHTGSLTLAQGSPAVFDKVLMNVGGAYDPSTGAFTCPTAGMYTFRIHVLDHGSSHGCLQLQVNGASISSAYADGDDWNTASTSAVLELQQGDVVTAVVCYPSTFHDNNVSSNHTDWGFQSNIFNGHLAQPNSCYA